MLNYLSKMREKEPLECRRIHIWALKTQKLPEPLSGPWTPAAKGLLHLHDSASLRRQLSVSEAGAPLDKILDPRLVLMIYFDTIWTKMRKIYSLVECIQYYDSGFWMVKKETIINSTDVWSEYVLITF